MAEQPDASESPDPLAWLEETRAEGSRVSFREQLRDIDGLLLELASSVADAIVPTTSAFLEADAQSAVEIAGTRGSVAARCVELEDACYVLLARQSPVGKDLRHVVAVLRSAQDVQRSANLLQHVAHALTWIHPPSLPGELRQTIRQLGDVAGALFQRAVAAWQAHDALAAGELAREDDQADLLQKYLLTELYTGEQSIEEAVSLALVARYYERIADHGVEVARHVAYALTGDRPGSPAGEDQAP